MDENQRPGVVKWARTFWDRTKDAFYIGGVAAGIIVGVLKWYKENYPPTEPVTVEEMREQFDAINGRFAQFAHSDSLYRDSLRIERARYDTIARVIVLAVEDVQKRVGRVESKLTLTNIEIESTRQQANRSNEEILSVIEQQSSQAERNKLVEKQQEQATLRQIHELLEAIAKKNKVTKIGM